MIEVGVMLMDRVERNLFEVFLREVEKYRQGEWEEAARAQVPVTQNGTETAADYEVVEEPEPTIADIGAQTPPAVKVTYEMLANALRAYSAKSDNGFAVAKAVLDEFEVPQLSKLPEEKYAAMFARLTR